MIYRNPRTISAEELTNLSGYLVAILYKEFYLEGYIGEVTLAINDSNSFSSFEFSLTSKCKAKLRSNIELIPTSFIPEDIKGISQID